MREDCALRPTGFTALDEFFDHRYAPCLPFSNSATKPGYGTVQPVSLVNSDPQRRYPHLESKPYARSARPHHYEIPAPRRSLLSLPLRAQALSQNIRRAQPAEFSLSVRLHLKYYNMDQWWVGRGPIVVLPARTRSE